MTLVVVRSGHSDIKALFELDAEPQFDIAISHFKQTDPVDFPNLKYHHLCVGGKWEGLYDFFKVNPDIIGKYDYIWLPDDDLKVPVSQINSFLALAREHDLDLCQPSLSWNSYYSHHITLHNTRFLLRYTNFVELMMPLFKAPLLKASLPLFEGRRFGSGLDYLWPRMMHTPLYRSAIIDAVQVQHLRPVGTGTLYRPGPEMRLSDQEGTALFGQLKLKQKALPLVTYAGLSPGGRPISSKIELMSRLLLGWPGSTKKRNRISPNKRLRLAWSHSVPNPLLTEQFAERIARSFNVSLA